MAEGALPAERRRDVILSLNTHRGERPLSPIEVAEAFDSLLKGGGTFSGIAELTGFGSTSTLREIHRLLRLRPEHRHLVGWGRSDAPLSMTTASQIARLDGDDQMAVVEAVMVHNLSSKEARYVAETRMHSGQSIMDCITAVLRLRPQIERKYLLIGAVTSKSVTNYLSAVTQRERDEILRAIMIRHVGGLKSWTAKLGTTRFTLLGDESFFEQVKRVPKGFEAAINAELEIWIRGNAAG